MNNESLDLHLDCLRQLANRLAERFEHTIASAIYDKVNKINRLILTRIRDLEDENARLRIALHDAIRRPLGVTPDSAAEFYDPRLAKEAEARRANGGRL